LRVHTTNDNAGPAEPLGGTLQGTHQSITLMGTSRVPTFGSTNQLGRATLRGILVRMFNLSQIWPLHAPRRSPRQSGR
jgi:hypothetical protein